MNGYYHIENQEIKGDVTIFYFTLLPDCCVYKGHFPGNPVAPGVCSIQMIKACAERMTGKPLFLGYIAQCRFSVLLTPQTTPLLRLHMQLSETEDIYHVKAVVCDDTKTYIEFKGDFTRRALPYANANRLSV